MLCSLFLITSGRKPASPWAWRTLERGSDCNVPIAHPMSYPASPASHLMAPPLHSSPEAASGSAQLPIYFPFWFKPGIVFPTQAKTPAGPATWY